MACDQGHLFCKECVYTDLLTQKKDMKRQKDRLEKLKKEADEEREQALEAARERVLRDFEQGQLSLSSIAAAATSESNAKEGSDQGSENWILTPLPFRHS